MSHIQKPNRRHQLSTGPSDTLILSSPSTNSDGGPSRVCKAGALKRASLRKTLDAVEQDLLAERERDVARLQGALKSERANTRRLQSRCSQQACDLKRQEQQICRLKAKMTQLLDRKASIELLNTMPKSLAKKTLKKGAISEERREETALRVALERQEAELRQASTLKHDLSAMLYSLRAHMEQTLQDTLVGTGDEMDCKRLLQSEEKLGDHVTGGVVQVWYRVHKRLGELASHGLSSSTAGTDQEKLLAQLQLDLEHSKQLVQLQQQLLQDSINPPLPPDLVDSYYLEDWERLRTKREEFESQRRCFQRERQAFTDAAIRLGWERRQFEQQKADLARQQFLCQSPFSQSYSCRTERSSTGNNTHPSCHAAMPSSQDVEMRPLLEVRTLATPDLYSALKLSHGPRRSKGTTSCLEHWDMPTERPPDHTTDLDWSF